VRALGSNRSKPPPPPSPAPGTPALTLGPPWPPPGRCDGAPSVSEQGVASPASSLAAGRSVLLKGPRRSPAVECARTASAPCVMCGVCDCAVSLTVGRSGRARTRRVRQRRSSVPLYPSKSGHSLKSDPSAPHAARLFDRHGQQRPSLVTEKREKGTDSYQRLGCVMAEAPSKDLKLYLRAPKAACTAVLRCPDALNRPCTSVARESRTEPLPFTLP